MLGQGIGGMGSLARPLASTLTMEIVGDGDDGPRVSTKVANEAEQRRKTIMAVQEHGGKVVGEQLSSREKAGRFVNSLRWQSAQLCAALLDLAMLIVEVNGGPLAVVNGLTALVLLVFCTDLVMRAYAYREMLFRSVVAYFDFTIVGASLILYLVGVIAEASEHVDTSRSVSASLRGLIVALRWLRALRVMVVVVRSSTSGQRAARQATGANKKRYIDLDAGYESRP